MSGNRHVVDRIENLPPGEVRIVSLGGREIGVINDGGDLYAIKNVCPHHGAPLCRGRIGGLMKPSNPHEYHYSGNEKENRVVHCPWHGYEFRLTSGTQVTDENVRVKTYDVRLEDQEVVLYV